MRRGVAGICNLNEGGRSKNGGGGGGNQEIKFDFLRLTFFCLRKIIME